MANNNTHDCLEGPRPHFSARYFRALVRLNRAGILLATNLEISLEDCLPSLTFRPTARVIPSVLSDRSSAASGNEPNSLSRSPISSFCRVDFPNVVNRSALRREI
jgi:hypothetical protein